MRLWRLFLTVGFLAFGVSALLATTPPPRKSPEFNFTEPSGKQTALSSFTGNVVVVEFLLTNCPHCMRVAKLLGKLQGELGQQGLRTIGVAFDTNITARAVTKFSQDLGVTYLVGYTSSTEVDSYLGRTPTGRLMVPQIVVIDRAGVIRAQSRPAREVDLEDETYLRHLIGELLQEAAPAASSKKSKRAGVKTNASKANLP